MTSIKNVAHQAQVSIATVSRVLNGTKYVSPDVEKRVLDAVEQLNYQPNAPARNLRRQRTLSIGILLPQLNDFFLSNLAYVLEKALSAEGYSPLFCSTENDEAKETAAIDNFISYRVEAVVMVPALPAQNPIHSVERLLDRDIPVVLIDRGMPQAGVNLVLSDNYQGGYDGAAYLIALGHRAIGIIDSVFDESQYAGGPGGNRIRGIRQAMLDYGVPLDPNLVITDALPNIEIGYHGTLTLLRRAPQVTAIFALTDAIAIGVLRAAFEAGLSVPRDLSVIGFDDIALASHVIPRLTTLRQPVEEMGRKATDLILRQIQNPDAAPETVALRAELVVRESTAPPRSDAR